MKIFTGNRLSYWGRRGTGPHTVLPLPIIPVSVLWHLHPKHTSYCFLPSSHRTANGIKSRRLPAPRCIRCSHAWNPGLGSAGASLTCSSVWRPFPSLVVLMPSATTVAPSGKLTPAWDLHGFCRRSRAGITAPGNVLH